MVRMRAFGLFLEWATVSSKCVPIVRRTPTLNARQFQSLFTADAFPAFGLSVDVVGLGALTWSDFRVST